MALLDDGRDLYGGVVHRLVDGRIGNHLGRRCQWDPGGPQGLGRKIDPADLGILIDIAQDIGELKRAAKMVRKLDAGFARHAKNADRQSAHRGSYPVAIEIELLHPRPTNVTGHVHRHAGDHRIEIGAVEIETAHRLRHQYGLPRVAAGIKRVEIAPPLVERQRASGILLRYLKQMGRRISAISISIIAR